MLEQSAIPMFANHQTFHPRFGWLKKGYNAAATDPEAFSLRSAPVDLGVGKNMVEAIRFWALATKVIVRRPHPDRPRLPIYTPSRIGRALLDDHVGFDPYIEDLSTLWILHWQAISAPSVLPVWRLAFNDFTAMEFSEADLLRFCCTEIAATTWSQPMESSIRKDVDCLLRMYSRRETRGRELLDDLIDSPFSGLELIQASPGKGRDSYRFVRGGKRSLSAAAITYACLDFMSRDGQGIRTISMTRLAVDPGSPGRIMKLTEQDITDAIEESSHAVTGLKIVRPAGSRQLAVDTDAALVALAVLYAQYDNHRIGIQRVEGVEVAGPTCAYPVSSDRQVAQLVRRRAKARPRLGNKDDAA
jgi:hypothetical protein